MTHLDLFSGIGGFALAAQWAGFETIGFCEIDPYAIRVLKKHWHDVPNFGDIRNLRRVSADLITGGFPCQPYSCAGKRKGSEDNRHLWPEMRRVIAEGEPSWVVGENVTGIIGMELDNVLSDLEGLGYSTLPFIIPACGVDAPHRRNRVWIVAHTSNGRRDARGAEKTGGAKVEQGGEFTCEPGGASTAMGDADSSPGERHAGCVPGAQAQIGGAREQDGNSADGLGDAGKTLADANQPGPQRRDSAELSECASERASGAGGSSLADTTSGEQRNGRWRWSARAVGREGWRGRAPGALQWLPEPDVGRVAHGIPSRVDRLKGLGNAIVPQVAYQILKAITMTIRDSKKG